MFQLTDFEKDQLREIVSIGAGNASTALSKMLGKKIKLSVPEVFLQSLEKIPGSIGEKEEVVTAVLLQIIGDVPALMLLVIPQESALNLLSTLLVKEKKEINIQNQLEKSAIQEVGNILSGNALTALSKFLGLKMVESVPDVVTDMFGAIMISILAEIGQATDQVLVFQSTLFVEEENITGHLLFIFNSKSSRKILEAINSSSLAKT